MTARQTDRASADLVPIADRLRTMQVFRFVVATVVTLFVAFVDNADMKTLGIGTLGYVLLSLAGELTWRAFRNRGLLLFGGMLILDGVYLAWVSFVSGGTDSPLRHLVLLHLIAVALLASYRTGLKLAMWHSILLLLVFELHDSAGGADGQAGIPGTSFEHMVTYMAVFWMVVLSTATFSAVNERELRRRRYDLEALAQLAAALEGVSHSGAVADVLVQRLVDSFGFERVALLVPDGDGHRLLAGHGINGGPDVLLQGGGRSVLDLAANARNALLLDRFDLDADRGLPALLPEARNLLVVPLLAEGGMQGVIVAEHSMRAGSRIERRVVTAVERFASHGGLSLRNAGLLEEMERMAMTDALTGVNNRRTFDDQAERELARAVRSREPMSIVMFDIDNFKRLNDTFGHREGDEVLRAVGAVLRQQCRSFDTVARYGGEEFAVVVPGCTAVDAVSMAERVRVAIAAIVHDSDVTISAGVASFPAHGDDVDTLVRLADGALYQSKRNGRNQVTAAIGQRATVA